MTAGPSNAQQVLVTAYLKRALPWSTLEEAINAFGAELHLRQASRAGLVAEASGLVAPGPTLEARVREIWRAERPRATSRGTELAAAMEKFHAANARLKAEITRVQVSPPPAGASAVGLIEAIQEVVLAVETFATLTPRVAAYVSRFQLALARREGGQTRYLASPLVDSMHTVLFELHQDLLEVSGAERVDE